MSNEGPAAVERRTADATPHAASLIQSLRDIGYSCETALADIIDNSITAGAKSIQVMSDASSAEPALGILDDGRGMSFEELVEAMRPGTRSPLVSRDMNDLGRFGLGLKSASFSQCKRLTVVTRKNGIFSGATWDLTGIQNTLRNRLHEHLKTIEDAIRVDGSRPDALANPVIAELHRCWEDEYSDVYPDWPDILSGLLSVVASAIVVSVNKDSPTSLDYDAAGENGLTVIAIGGFSLSRGLTLEGLTVSYFLRNSLMYDTLMQMGRWFGYRPDYEDLCRIWMLRDAASWYAHISDATEELQNELKRMEQLNATPMQFGLAVRSHPSALMITARNKMGSGEKHVLVGLSNSFVETTRLALAPGSIDQNRTARDRFMTALAEAGHDQTSAKRAPGGLLVSGVRVELIDDFLRSFDNHPESLLTAIAPVRRYIADRRADELETWDVLVTALKPSPDLKPEDLGGWKIAPMNRSIGASDLAAGVLSISGSRARVASRGMEKAGLSDAQIELAELDYCQEKKEPEGARLNFPDRVYRQRRNRPLLLLYNIRIKEPDEPNADKARIPAEPVVGWGISFPQSARPDQRVEYMLNTTKLRELFGDPDEDEGAEAEDDDV